MKPSRPSLFTGSAGCLWVQIVRYTFVGGLAFVVDFGALFALTHILGIHYLISAGLAFGLGLATNYAISVVWVFDQRAVQSRWAEFLIFALLGVVGLGLNELTIYVLTDWFGMHYLASKVGATGLTYVWNFASRKMLLFSLPPKSAPRPTSPSSPGLPRPGQAQSGEPMRLGARYRSSRPAPAAGASTLRS